MCRSSTKSIGFLMLLWIGIFTPVAEYQMSHFAEPASPSGVLDVALSDDGGQEGALVQADDDGSHVYPSGGADLSDFLIAADLPRGASMRHLLLAHRVAEGFKSRDLPPQERPPNTSTA